MIRFDRKLYMGIVEDNYDPKRKGRIKVRVQSIYNVIPLEDIPYASPFMDIAGKEYKVPSIGKIVNVLFLTNDKYDPYYIYSQNYNINLENKLNDLSDDEYVDFVALLFDDRTQISADNEELTIDHLYNKITINKESINHELKDNTQLLNLGDRGATQDAVLGNHWFDWMDKFVNALLQPTSLLGNQSAPIVKPQIDVLLQEYQSIRHTFVSNHVKIVDNNKVTPLERDPRTDASKEDKSLIDNTINIDSFIGYDTDINTKELQDKIETQNKKACQNQVSSSPSSALSQPETESHDGDPDFTPEGGSYEKRLINGKIYTVTDANREELNNLEKSLKADKFLGNNYTPSGKYKGQNYLINSQYDKKNKIYNPEEIENMKISIPESVGLYPIYNKGVEIGKKPAVKLKNRLIISDYYPAYIKMADAAKLDGVTLILNDAYRTYQEQYNIRMKNAPKNKKSDVNFLKTARSKNFTPETAAPGYGRHHYGIAFDISTSGGKNSAYKWLKKNALNFGFIRTVKSETWHWEWKPWNVIKINAWDKYAIVPKGHSSWGEDNDNDTQFATKQPNRKDVKPNDIKEC